MRGTAMFNRRRRVRQTIAGSAIFGRTLLLAPFLGCLVSPWATAQQSYSPPQTNRWSTKAASLSRSTLASSNQSASKPAGTSPSLPSPTVVLRHPKQAPPLPHSTAAPANARATVGAGSSPEQQLDQLESASLRIKLTASSPNAPNTRVSREERSAPPINFTYHEPKRK